MRQTEKYQFNLIDPEDHFLPDPLNENMEKTEAALTACSHIVAGSYVGTGTYGSNNPCTLTFDFEPKLVMVYKGDMGFMGGAYNGAINCAAIIAPRNATKSTRQAHIYASISGLVYDNFIWTGNTFSWYTTSTQQSQSGTLQLNESGVTYYYVAIG